MCYNIDTIRDTERVSQRLERIDIMNTFAKVMVVVGIMVVVLGLNFGFDALAIYVASKIFGFTFKWIYVIGLMVATSILSGIFKSSSKD